MFRREITIPAPRRILPTIAQSHSGDSGMRLFILLFAVSTLAFGQAATPVSSAPAEFNIPAGTKVPLALKHAISTKTTHEGDAVYAETTFPIVANGRVLIPAGTYVQGRISRIQRAGHIKGRAEVLMHFTTLIYPS